jgi:hypothetical protein
VCELIVAPIVELQVLFCSADHSSGFISEGNGQLGKAAACEEIMTSRTAYRGIYPETDFSSTKGAQSVRFYGPTQQGAGR